VLRSELEGQADPAAKTDSTAKPGDASVVDGRLVVGDYTLSPEDIAALMQQKANDDLRKARMPSSPDGYELKLPADFKMPDGVEFKLDTSNPIYQDVRRWAFSKQLDGQAVSEMLGIYASHQAAEEAKVRAAGQREVEKLGTNATARITALNTWMRGAVGDELAGALGSMMVTEKSVRALEKLQARFTNQGAASFSQAHRVPHEETGGRWSEEQYNAASPGQRLDYTRQFDQRQFNNPR
jgi:hypothetical protein